MAAKFTVFCGAVVIDSTNNTIRLEEDSATYAFDVVLDAGTYFVNGRGSTYDDLLAELKSKLDAESAAHGGSYTYTVSITWFADVDAGQPFAEVEITSTGTNLNWKGSHANHTFPSTVIGLYNAQDSGPTATLNSHSIAGQSPDYNWVCHQPTADEKPKPPTRPAQQNETAGGQTYTYVTGAKVKRRVEEFQHVAGWYVYEELSLDEGIDEGQAFEKFWDNCGDGRRWQVYHVELSSGLQLAALSVNNFVDELVPSDVQDYPDFVLDFESNLYSFNVPLKEYKA